MLQPTQTIIFIQFITDISNHMFSLRQKNTNINLGQVDIYYITHSTWHKVPELRIRAALRARIYLYSQRMSTWEREALSLSHLRCRDKRKNFLNISVTVDFVHFRSGFSIKRNLGIVAISRARAATEEKERRTLLPCIRS